MAGAGRERKHGGPCSRGRPQSRRQRRGPGPGLGERPLCRANVTSPHPHRFPPECARSAGDPGAPPGHRPRPAASTRSRPGSGAARRHHAGHPEDPPAADLQDRHRPRRDGECGGSAGPGTGQGRRARRPSGLGWGRCGGAVCGAPASASREAQRRARAGRPPVHPRGPGERGLGPRALDEACGLRARAGPGGPAACGPPDLQSWLWALWQE